MKLLGTVTGGSSPTISPAHRFLCKDSKKMQAWWKELADRRDLTIVMMAHGEPVVADTETVAAKLRQIANQF